MHKHKKLYRYATCMCLCILQILCNIMTYICRESLEYLEILETQEGR